MASLVRTSHPGYVKSVAFDHSGRRIACASADERPRIEVIDMDDDGKFTIRHPPWSAHEQTINKLCWGHPRFGQILASCSDDASVEIWEEQDSVAGTVAKWHKRATLSDARKPIKDIAFCPNHLGLKIALACMDGRVYIYEAHDVTRLNLSDWTLEEYFDAFEPPRGSLPSSRNAGVRCLAWNPSKFDNPMIVAGSESTDDHSALVRVWQFQEATRKWVMCCELEKHYRADTGGCQVNDVDWAPNMGRSYHLIASAGQDSEHQLKIHRLNRTPEGLVPAAGPNADLLTSGDQAQGIWRVEFNVTGTVLASSGEEGVVRLWKSTFRGDWKEVKSIASDTI